MKMFGAIAAIGLTFYVGVGLLMFFVQRSLVFFPHDYTYHSESETVKPYEIGTGSNGTIIIRGYVVNEDDSGPVVVFFTGNGGTAGEYVDELKTLQVPVVVTNYRGYGQSEGKPSQSAILQDVQVILEWVREKFAGRQLVLMGFSLGTGVAILSCDDNTAGIVLVSPYRSLVRMAPKPLAAVYPLKVLMRDKFETLEMLESLPDKVLVIYSLRDLTIPPDESTAVLDLLPQAEVKTDSVRHNELMSQQDNLTKIREWLNANFRE